MDVPEDIKYHDLIDELKKNGDIKGLSEYIADHILPVLENKEDQTITRVTGLLDIRYGRSRTERVEEAIEDLFSFREEDYEEDDALMMAMKQIRQRRMDLNFIFNKFHAVWMLMKLKKRKKIESHGLQALRNVVKENAADVVARFETKF